MDLLQTITKQVPGHIFVLLKKIGILADQKKVKVFLVGGFVRDLFLETKSYDIDVTVQADAISFAEEFAQNYGMMCVEHKGFKTATLQKGDFRIDFATTRKEYYSKPAALPTIALGGIRDDLRRRDFTINAMAVSLNQPSFAVLCDYFNGMDDIKHKVIRALHKTSFIDDPTRIIRAVRFEQRLGFVIEPHTARFIQRAVNQKIFDQLKKQRFEKELKLLYDEPRAKYMAARLIELGVAVVPG